ncbi:histone-lysine N-methyltransferase prdM9 [Caudoviricetes sp.]|nr:histone-lysine N-methyltransferase prdM9 [Caudoviricetes sp.]UOF81115.1 histone-lysine N-methyltransferase prdM9 [Caudoviricetes sp.]UOF82249.1 histone-lysine N-methyltransferase prdM9 [Caudoviricetes sp.]UOF82460.1 histone-lysine N-methyltransferase prdM9 [Caudoviricetes sp.]UOF82614.1 histone-lysine N-methyltransferase prdM9 [Caudoviricetes sp.]
MTTLLSRIWSYLVKLSCGHIKSTDTLPQVGDQEWCNMCGDFRTVKQA